MPLPDEGSPIIDAAARLSALRSLRFTATPGRASQTGWAGHGTARIQASTDRDGIRLYERGHFTPAAAGTPIAFENVYRWVEHNDRLSLWHERHGRDAAVWLFDLVAADHNSLVTAAPHPCGADEYDARLTLTADGFDLRWSITGPRKNETLAYRYRMGAHGADRRGHGDDDDHTGAARKNA